MYIILKIITRISQTFSFLYFLQRNCLIYSGSGSFSTASFWLRPKVVFLCLRCSWIFIVHAALQRLKKYSCDQIALLCADMIERGRKEGVAKKPDRKTYWLNNLSIKLRFYGNPDLGILDKRVYISTYLFIEAQYMPESYISCY